MSNGRIQNPVSLGYSNGRHEQRPRRRRPAAGLKSGTLINANEITRKYGLSYQTLNYYTNMGLLAVVKKVSSQRLYHEPDLRKRLKLITKLKDQGYPLQLIRQVLSSKKAGVIR